MAKQLRDLLIPLSSMSDNDLMAKIEQIRKNKKEIKPATTKHNKATTKKKVGKIADLMSSLPEEERLKMMKMLEDD